MVAELIREAGFTAFAWAAGMEMLLDRLCRRMEDAR